MRQQRCGVERPGERQADLRQVQGARVGDGQAVDDGRIQDLGPKVGALDFVSHSYHRPRHLPIWPYNLFAMVHGASREEVEEKVKVIADLLGSAARAHDVLYSTRILKKTGLRIAA